MKKWILVMVMLAGLSVSAQQKEWQKNDHPHRDMREVQKLTPEQRSELEVKKMTLALDLTDAQQKDIKKLMADRNKKREAAVAKFKANKEVGKKLTDDERFAMKSNLLDEQIAMKREMKKILNADQYEKFNKMQQMRHKKAKEHFKQKHFDKKK